MFGRRSARMSTKSLRSKRESHPWRAQKPAGTKWYGPRIPDSELTTPQPVSCNLSDQYLTRQHARTQIKMERFNLTFLSGQIWKVLQTIPASPFTPGQTLKKSAPNHGKPLHPPFGQCPYGNNTFKNRHVSMMITILMNIRSHGKEDPTGRLFFSTSGGFGSGIKKKSGCGRVRVDVLNY